MVDWTSKATYRERLASVQSQLTEAQRERDYWREKAETLLDRAIAGSAGGPVMHPTGQDVGKIAKNLVSAMGIREIDSRPREKLTSS